MAALGGSSLSAAPAVAASPSPAAAQQRPNKSASAAATAAAVAAAAAGNRCEIASPMPDLSHLTEEERRIIESVLMRQRLEEEQETEIVRRQADEVQLLEEAIRQRSEHQRKAGAELDATCQLCLKTKFADGLGHACHYCNARCCARCGGKVALRSAKVIWVCILCRKKQELVVKTGKWILPTGGLMQQQPGGSASGGASHLMINDKRPRLERAVSYERDNSGGGGVRPGVSSMSSSCAYGSSSGAPTHAPLQRSGSLQSHGPSSWRPLPSDVNPLASRGITAADYGPSSGNVGSSSSALRQPASLGGINPAGGNRDMTCRRSNSGNPWTSQDSWSEYGRDPYGDNGGKTGAHSSQDPQSQSTSQQSAMAKRGLAGRSNSYDYDPYHQDDYGRNRADMIKSGGSMSGANLKDRNLPPQPLHHHHLHHRHRHPHHHHHHQRQPQSSSEDELRSTSECTSCEDVEVESESVSEKGEMDTVNDRSWPANQASRNQANRGGRFKAQTLAHPVTWQPNSDGTKMIGRMILNKNMSASLAGGGGAPGQQQGGMSSNPSSASILGLKVVGGKRVDNGRLAAIVEKVKRGSIADSIGHLRPGDEVLEWNGQPLQGRTFEEVYDIITESRADQEIEIIVSRPISDVGRPSSLAGSSGSGSGQHGQMHGSTDRGYLARSGSLRSGGSRARDRPAVTVTSPASPETLHPSWGKVQVKLWYDTATQQLSVTIVGAFDLPPRPNGALRNPYAKLFLLPDKSEKSKRRTRALASTLEPRWNQTFLYSNLRRSELRSRFLEITVWDSDRLDTGRLIGEVVVDLSAAPLDGEADWYTLTSHEESIQILRRAGLQMVDSVSSPVGSVDHLSPPSTSSRLSDSEPDPSDPGEGDDGGGGGMGHGHHRSSRHSRAMERGGRSDGASVSSMGSSSSPPLDSEYPDHRRSRQRSGTLVAADDLKYGMGSRGAILDRSRPRSHSAAPTEISDHHRGLERTPSGRSRSKSPRRISEPGRRSLSPSEERLPGDGMRGGVYGGGSGAPRLTSRSATATPTGSPKRRHLPQIPAALQQTSFSRVRQDVEERARMLKLRIGPTPSYSVASAGSSRSWRSYSGHSDNDLPPPRQSSVRGSGTSSQGHKGGVGHSSRGNMRSGASTSGGKILSPDREGGPGGGGDSDVESMVSFVSGTSALSTQSERPSAYSKRTGDRRVELLDRNQDIGGAAGDIRSGSSFRRNQLGRSLSQSDVPVTEKNDGSLSDTALNSGILDAPDRSVTWRRSGGGGSASSGMQHYGDKSDKSGGLSKKSNSTSQLSATEGGGMMQRKRSSSGGSSSGGSSRVQRSQEVLPHSHAPYHNYSYAAGGGQLAGQQLPVGGPHHQSVTTASGSSSSGRLVRQTSRDSNDGSLHSVSSESSSWVGLARLTSDGAGGGPLADFVEGLGPGQLVGRQVLAAPALGDVQLALCDRKGRLEVEVIRARGLQARPGSKLLPAPYVKVYLVSGKRCLAKAKTATARRTLDPLYQQQLSFHVPYQGCVLQVTVWGDYGRIEGRKVFMGVAQILLDDLDLSNIVIGWYKLFGTASLVSLPPPQAGQQHSQQHTQGQQQQQQQQQQRLTRRGSQQSLDSVG